jgi:hypothetical protein
MRYVQNRENACLDTIDQQQLIPTSTRREREGGRTRKRPKKVRGEKKRRRYV